MGIRNVCVCLCVCVEEHRCMYECRCCWSSKDGVGSPGSEVIGSCGPHCVGTGEKKSTFFLYSRKK